MKNICVVFLIVFLRLHFEVRAEDGFIRVERKHLMLNGSPFYGNGFNAYWLMYVASDPSQRDKVSSAFQEAANHSLVIARTWAFRDGGFSPLQYSPSSYNEQMFQVSLPLYLCERESLMSCFVQGLDYVISEARKHGIKLILSLVNNYNDSGGKHQYLSWARNEGQKIFSDDDFFTDSLVKTYYKNHIKVRVSLSLLVHPINVCCCEDFEINLRFMSKS